MLQQGKQRLRLWLTGIVLLMTCFYSPLQATEINGAPCLNQGEKWRLAYYQGGEYRDYYQYLRATAEGLMEQGWVSPQKIPSQPSSARELWDWLSVNADSEYIEFLSDGFYSADWDREYRVELREQVVGRLQKKGEINLILAMGTWAGIDIAIDGHRVPTMVISVNDPRSAGLVQDDDSHRHIYIPEDPQRYERQVTLFHDLIRFKTLGVAFENSFEGRSYASIETIERLAEERNFQVISCHTQSDIADQIKVDQSVIDCFNELAEKVDAIYVTVQGGINNHTTPVLVEIANQHSIPTFSQYGQREVKLGYLMSLSQVEGFRDEGRLLSHTAGKILNGEEPASLMNVSAEANRITLNLKTAEQIGLYLDAEMLAAADQLYWQIEQP